MPERRRYETALAGLLRDIGKFLQKRGVKKHHAKVAGFQTETKKVYCKNCKYMGWESVGRYSYYEVCNKTAEIIDTGVRPTLRRNKCDYVNRNNDCKNWEEHHTWRNIILGFFILFGILIALLS